MKCFKYFAVLLDILLCNAVSAQNIFVGNLVDEKGNEVINAVVSVMSQNKAIYNTITNDRGTFSIVNVENGHYSLAVSCMGYKPGMFDVTFSAGNSMLGTFTLQSGLELDEVTITPEPLITAKVDRIIYDVSSDPDAKTASTAQILNKIPFVKVDRGSSLISVYGEQDFVITINGKQSLLLSEANQYVAQALAASQLNQIELITTPTGKFKNKSAVINIVTHSSVSDGLVGQIDVGASNNDKNANGQASVTSKAGKLIYNASYRLEYSDLYGYRKEEVLNNLSDGAAYSRYESLIRSNPLATLKHTGSVNASIDLTPQDLITAKFKFSTNRGKTDETVSKQYYDVANALSGSMSSVNSNSSGNDEYTGSLNYQRSFESHPGRMLTMTYQVESKNNSFDYDLQTSNLLDGTEERLLTQNLLGNVEHMAAIDFASPVGTKHIYYVTGKYSHRTYSSENNQSGTAGTPLAAVGGLDYTEQVAVLSGNYSLRGGKLMLTVSADLNYTSDDARFRNTSTSFTKDAVTLNSSLRLVYRPSMSQTIIFNAEKNPFRPDITFLNPYEDVSVPGVVRKGNPNLDNEQRYRAMLLYRYAITDNITGSITTVYVHSGNSVASYSYLDGDKQIYTYANIGRDDNFRLSAGMDMTLFDCLDVRITGIAVHHWLEYPGNKNSYWDPSVDIYTDAELWKGGVLSINAFWRNSNFAQKTNTQYSSTHNVLDASVELSQRIGKKLRVGVGVNDPWCKYQKYRETLISDAFESSSDEWTRKGWVAIGLTYKFGGFNKSVKSASRAASNLDRTKE